jgi:hypothetical protein
MTDTRRLDEHTAESRSERPDWVNRTERQPAVKLTGVVAAGLAAALAAFFTSRFGITGTVLGTALTAMIITVGSALLGFYLERAAAKARSSVPGVVRVRSPRRSVLLGGLLATLLAAVTSFVIGIGVVTSVELSVGKSLSCWVWNACPTKDAGGGAASEGAATRTHPSVLGGGKKSVVSTPQPGGVEQPRETAPLREQKVPDSRHAPQGLPDGSIVRPEPRKAPQSSAGPAQDARSRQAPGGGQPAQEHPRGTLPGQQALKEEPGSAPDDSDRPSSSDEPPADRPQSEQPVRPSTSIF